MFRRALVAVAIATAAFFTLGAGVALAQEIPNDGSAVAPVAALTIPAGIMVVITSLLIPVITGIFTKLDASVTVKQIFTAFVSGAVGLLTTATQADGTAVISTTSAWYALLAFLIATFGYLGLYQPRDTNAKLAPAFGLG